MYDLNITDFYENGNVMNVRELEDCIAAMSSNDF